VKPDVDSLQSEMILLLCVAISIFLLLIVDDVPPSLVSFQVIHICSGNITVVIITNQLFYITESYNIQTKKN
jgi:membrane protein YdbS with pleckstrin-like domain